MRKRRKAKIVTATLPMATMEKLASEFCPLHAARTAEGYQLTAKCRLWQRSDRSWTVRFVHVRPDEPALTLTTIIRGVVLR